jgi:hypothetical protein
VNKLCATGKELYTIGKYEKPEKNKSILRREL